MRKVYFGAAIFLILTSCQQDPYADFQDQVKNGQFPNQPYKPQKSIDDKMIRLDTVSPYFNFEEGIEGFAGIHGVVLEPDIPYVVTIENGAEFPGFKFNAQAGEFTWSPPFGYVLNKKVMDSSIIVALRTQETEKFHSKEKIISVPIFIKKKLNAPTFLNISDLPDNLESGKKYEFSISFTDVDADDSVAGATKIELLPIAGSTWITNAIKQATEKAERIPNTTNDWNWRFTLDMTDKNFGFPDEKIKFGFRLKSRFDVNSDLSPHEVTIKKQVEGGLRFSVVKDTVFQAPIGEKTVIKVTVWDVVKDGSFDMDLPNASDFGTDENQNNVVDLTDCNWGEDGFRSCSVTITPVEPIKGQLVIHATHDSPMGLREAQTSIWIDVPKPSKRLSQNWSQK